MSGKADAAFFASLPENISALDRRQSVLLLYGALRESCSAKPLSTLSNNNAAITMTLLLIVMALCACVYYIVAPFVRLARRMPLSALTPPVTYFCAIGMGFMLIEISQMQRLMVFLGHPGLRAERRALHDSSVQRHRQHHGRCARPSAGRGRRQACRSAGNARGGGAADSVAHRLGAIGSHRHAHSVVGIAAGAPGILHGDDVPART